MKSPKSVAAILVTLARGVRDGSATPGRVRQIVRRVLAAMETQAEVAEFLQDEWYDVWTPEGQVIIPASEAEKEGPLPEGSDLEQVRELARRLPHYFKSAILKHSPETGYSEHEVPHAITKPALKDSDVSIEKSPSSWGFRERGARLWMSNGFASEEEARAYAKEEYPEFDGKPE